MSSIFWFLRKVARTKTQKSTNKVSEHNGRTLFSRVLALITRAWTGEVSTSSFSFYPLFVLLPHYLGQLPFSLPPQYAATGRVCLPPLGLGRNAKSYDRVFPDCQTRSIWWWWHTPLLPNSLTTTILPDTHLSSFTVTSTKDPPPTLAITF